MSSFTCISCRVSFRDAELQRTHYKSDWHRYNLKRKVAELPPISSEDFQQKLLSQRLEEAKEQESSTSFCRCCGKGFSSLNSYNNHLKSKKHLIELEKSKLHNDVDEKQVPTDEKSGSTCTVDSHQKIKKSKEIRARTSTAATTSICKDSDESDDDEWEDVEEEEINGDVEDDESLPPNFCLFCPHRSVNAEDNLRHMSRSHSFFLPDVDYLTDIEGLLTYLGAKVGDGKVCLYCNERSRNFPTLESVRMHMIDKGHCKIAYEGDSAMEYSDFYDFSESYPSEASGDDATDDVADTDEVSDRLGALDIDDDTMELVLPSGARAGHRAYKAYYKQSLPPEHLRKTKAAVSRIGYEYRALGWHGTLAVDVKRKMAVMKRVNQQRDRHNVQLQVKANQFRFRLRPQVIF